MIINKYYLSGEKENMKSVSQKMDMNNEVNSFYANGGFTDIKKGKQLILKLSNEESTGIIIKINKIIISSNVACWSNFYQCYNNRPTLLDTFTVKPECINSTKKQKSNLMAVIKCPYDDILFDNSPYLSIYQTGGTEFVNFDRKMTLYPGKDLIVCVINDSREDGHIHISISFDELIF